MVATFTKPYCGSCGWKVGGQYPDKHTDGKCDACGADLRRFGWGPANPPSLSNASGLDGKVSFSWTADPTGFPQGYEFRYSIAGAEWVVVENPTSPYEVTVTNGTEVCGELRGKADNIWSDWSAEKCATATA
jgi:hypothetical protein